MPKLSIAGSVRISEVAQILAEKGWTLPSSTRPYEPRKRSPSPDPKRMAALKAELQKMRNAEKRANYKARHPKKYNEQQNAKPSRRSHDGPRKK